MCLIVFAYKVHPEFPLLVVGNRDEFHARPSDTMHWWPGRGILAGRDLQAGGTWAGVNKAGRFAVVTNVREPGMAVPEAHSRGELTTLALGEADIETVRTHVLEEGHRYNGFNLLLGDADQLYHAGNRPHTFEPLEPGIYGLSNANLNTPWPKLLRARDALSAWLDEGRADLSGLFALMADRRCPPDDALPDTGIPLDWERLLSPPFIVSDTYGTRSSSLFLISPAHGLVAERVFGADGRPGESRYFHVSFRKNT